MDEYGEDADLYGDGGLDEDMYGDPEVAVAQYKPELPPEVAITMDSIYVTDEISTQPWYAGRIDRAETEARIKSGTRAGNFLIRQKGEDGNTFVHSYLSLTRMTIIHNVIVFNPDGSCSVDGKPWVHHKKPKLAEVVDVMQQIRRARKGVKETADVDPAVAKKVIEMWDVIAPKGMNRSDANKAVMKLGLGGFHVIQMPNPKHYLLIIKTTNGCFEASLVKSAQGYYMRFSELIAESLQGLVAQMMVNQKAAFTAGLPHALDPDQITAGGGEDVPPPRPPPMASRPTEELDYDDIGAAVGDVNYDEVDNGVIGGDEDLYDDMPHDPGANLPDDYDEADYNRDADGPPPRPPKITEAAVYGDDLYGD